MKVTIKGQVTIPIALRERFGLEPGTEVEFADDDGVLHLRPSRKSRNGVSPFDRWLAKAAGSAKPGTTTDELMAMTRGED